MQMQTYWQAKSRFVIIIAKNQRMQSAKTIERRYEKRKKNWTKNGVERRKKRIDSGNYI